MNNRSYQVSEHQFFRNYFVGAGAEALYAAIIKGETLDVELAPILAKLSLPALAKLIDIQRLVLGLPEKRTVRPLLLLPVAQLLESVGPEQAAQRLLKDLAEQELNHLSELFFTVDRWIGKFSLNSFLELLQIVRDSTNRPLLLPVGPSTAEISELLKNNSSLEELFSLLNRYKFCTVSGGSDLMILRAAAAAGLSISFSHDISFLLENALFYHGPRDEHVQLLEERLIAELLELRSELLPTGNLFHWFPWTASSTQGLTSGSAFSVPILRALAIGRLMLPEVHSIRAPLTLLGVPLATVTPMFGAYDFGYAAVNAETARLLQIYRLSDASPLLEGYA